MIFCLCLSPVGTAPALKHSDASTLSGNVRDGFGFHLNIQIVLKFSGRVGLSMGEVNKEVFALPAES